MSKLWHAFQEGGWVMYPLFALGLLAVAAAARFALRGEHQLLGFIRWLTLSVLSTGLFGFTVGMTKVLTASQSPSEGLQAARILMEGTSEAASLLSASLLFSALICLSVAIGHRRFPLPNPSAVAR